MELWRHPLKQMFMVTQPRSQAKVYPEKETYIADL